MVRLLLLNLSRQALGELFMARRPRVQINRPRGDSNPRRLTPRWQIDRQRQRVAIAIGALSLLIILGLPTWGYITTFVLPPGKVIARVNEEAITQGDLLDKLQILQRGSEVSGQQLDLGTTPFQVFETMVQNEIIKQFGPELQISATPLEVDNELQARHVPDWEDFDDDSLLQSELSERLRQYLNLIQLDEADYRDQIETDLLRQKATAELGKDIAPIQPQIELYMLTVGSEEAIELVQQSHEQGTTFADLVNQYEINEEVKALGGRIGWVPQGLLSGPAAELFDLELGMITDPGRDEDGNYVFYSVLDRADARELESSHLAQLMQDVLEQWISNIRKEQTIETTFGSEEYDWLVKQLRSSSRAMPQ